MRTTDTSSITQSFGRWLDESGLLPLDSHSFAFLALPTDHSRVVALNHELRTISAPWLPGRTSWPDEHWAIGQDGAGNYFTVLRTEPRGVYSMTTRPDSPQHSSGGAATSEDVARRGCEAGGGGPLRLPAPRGTARMPADEELLLQFNPRVARNADLSTLPARQ